MKKAAYKLLKIDNKDVIEVGSISADEKEIAVDIQDEYKRAFKDQIKYLMMRGAFENVRYEENENGFTIKSSGELFLRALVEDIDMLGLVAKG
jgi:hypothetical protein